MQTSCRDVSEPSSLTDATVEDGQGAGAISRSPWGTVVGEYKGVTAYSNGLDHGTDGTPYGPYGYQYQCVEYVNRFYVVALGHSGYTCGSGNMRGCGHATTYYANAEALNLDAFPNGASTPPRADDILVFAGNTYGHVAIIRQVSPDGVRIIQQNWYNNGDDNDKFVAMTVTNGTYAVANLSDGYHVRGWLRQRTALQPTVGVSPAAGAVGTTFAVTGSGFSPNKSATSHVRRPNGTELPTSTVSTDASGRFSHSIPSAGLALGDYDYWAVDDASQTTSNTVRFSVTSGAPVPPPPPPPPPPTNLQPDVVNITTSPVTLRVNPIPGVIEYEFRIDYRKNDAWVYYYTYSSSTNTVTFWPQVAGTSYRWLARARNEGGWGGWSYDAVFWFNP